MDHVPGRIFKDHLLGDCTPEERRAIYTEMVNTLCKIHSVNIDAAGIGDYGKQGKKINVIILLSNLNKLIFSLFIVYHYLYKGFNMETASIGV